MRLQSLLLTLLFSATGFGQGTTTADYYQYQRDQQFKQYMENVSSKGMAGPVNANFNYSIDKRAVQEMVDLWDRRNKRTGSQYSPEELAKLNAKKNKLKNKKEEKR